MNFMKGDGVTSTTAGCWHKVIGEAMERAETRIHEHMDAFDWAMTKADCEEPDGRPDQEVYE